MVTQVTFGPGERWIAARGWMMFRAQAAGRDVTCTVTEEALKVHFGADQLGRFEAFLNNRSEIESVAVRKIQAGDVVDDELAMASDDFLVGEEFISWAR